MASWRDHLINYDALVAQQGPQPSTGTFTGTQLDQALNFMIAQSKITRDMGESGFSTMDVLVDQLNEFGKTLTTGLDKLHEDIKMESYSESLGGVGPNGNRLGVKVDMLAKRVEDLNESGKTGIATMTSNMNQA